MNRHRDVVFEIFAVERVGTVFDANAPAAVPLRAARPHKFKSIDPHMAATKPTTVDEYIEGASTEAQSKLRELRAVLKDVAPDATETLKWGMPVFEEGRILFAYAAYKSHLNFTPTGPALEPFKEDLAGFELGKDSIKLPYDKPLPEALIRKIAAYRARDVRENDARWMY